jgi:hypothetical protein
MTAFYQLLKFHRRAGIAQSVSWLRRHVFDSRHRLKYLFWRPPLNWLFTEIRTQLHLVQRLTMREKLLPANSTEQRHSLRANSSQMVKKLVTFYGTGKIHHNIHKSMPQAFIPSQANESHTTKHISLRSILILSTHLRLGLLSDTFLQAFQASLSNLFAFRAKIFFWFPACVLHILPISPSFDPSR